MAKISIERPDDETIEIHVNGEMVASANHDEHGWSGMDAVERTALAVSRALAKPPAGALPAVEAFDHRDEAITLLDAATLAPADRDYTADSAEVIAAAQVHAILHLADVIARLTTTEETRTDG